MNLRTRTATAAVVTALLLGCGNAGGSDDSDASCVEDVMRAQLLVPAGVAKTSRNSSTNRDRGAGSNTGAGANTAPAVIPSAGAATSNTTGTSTKKKSKTWFGDLFDDDDC